jgi:plastocyanin
MRRFTAGFAVVLVASLQVACSDASTVLQPPASSAAARGSDDQGTTRRIEMLDACDPTSFDAVLGAGSCTRPGGIVFADFIAQLTARGTIASWRFSPGQVEARVGQTLLAINRGGEAHTFTEVAEFGGGIVPLLNDLTGNPVVAPECQALAPADFIPPGGSTTDDVDEVGSEKYQCCIHPWMRTTVDARARGRS